MDNRNLTLNDSDVSLCTTEADIGAMRIAAVCCCLVCTQKLTLWSFTVGFLLCFCHGPCIRVLKKAMSLLTA